MILFCANFFLPWMSTWHFGYQHNPDSTITLVRYFKIKWWDKFQAFDKCNEDAFLNWLQKRPNVYSLPNSALQAQTEFLAQKSFALPQLAAATSEDEFFRIMNELVESKKSASKASSSKVSQKEDSEPSDYEPIIDFDNDNEDDCFGIFSLAQS